jgi:hypothetical protein
MTPENQAQIRALKAQLEISEEKLDKLEDSVSKLSISVDELVKAWGTAKGMTAFIKWLASLATAAGAIYAALHNMGPK